MEIRKVDQQASVENIEGISEKCLALILINPSSNLNYVTPQAVNVCVLQRTLHDKSWQVQLATGVKRKVYNIMKPCQFEMGGLLTQATLNVFPLGSYDMLIDMYW